MIAQGVLPFPPPPSTPLLPSSTTTLVRDCAYAALHSNISRTDRMNWDSSRRRRCEAVTKAENPGGDELGTSTRTAYLSARRKERIKLPDFEGPITFSDFLNHPSGVEALLNTRALHSFQPLDSHTYRCTLQKIQFLKFEVAPVLDLRVTPTREGCTVEMLDCRVYTKPFSLLPLSAVEKPGNLLMQGLLDRLVPLLVEQLLNDYRTWI
uniref:Uncharacterized protein LOC105050903 isoform X7 n=1 Tax=Elaeis guineensis var. tenera TaxID=51953 RepID=A0A8N4F026_ELAGV|nr:uncharacterized protein LOC105050903 isoform X7 [Elaeis guineensis]